MGARRWSDGQLADRFRKTFFQGHEKQAIVAPKTLRATGWLQQENGEQVAFRKGTAARTEADVAATIFTVKFEELLKPELVGSTAYHNYTSDLQTRAFVTAWVNSNNIGGGKPIWTAADSVLIVRCCAGLAQGFLVCGLGFAYNVRVFLE